MLGRGAFERVVERTSHAIAGGLDILWATPAAIRLNRTPIASAAVLVLAAIAAILASGGFGVRGAAGALPIGGDRGPGPEVSAPPAPSTEPEATGGPTFTFAPVSPVPVESTGGIIEGSPGD